MTTDYECHVPPPPPVGGYLLGDNLAFAVTRRPHFVARFLARWLLDWRWFDGPRPPVP